MTFHVIVLAILWKISANVTKKQQKKIFTKEKLKHTHNTHKSKMKWKRMKEDTCTISSTKTFIKWNMIGLIYWMIVCIPCFQNFLFRFNEIFTFLLNDCNIAITMFMLFIVKLQHKENMKIVHHVTCSFAIESKPK